MNSQTTLLITDQSENLLAELARRRPDWRIIPLRDMPPAGPLTGRVWSFVDWLCPSLSGLELCRRLREADATKPAHITMVLDTANSDDMRRALQAGADDYVIGPINADQLLQRMESVSGDSVAPQAQRQRLTHGPLRVDLAAHQVRHAGAIVPLRPNEFYLLVHFLENPDQVFSRSALIERLGKHALGIDERTVDVWIGRLRRALIAQGAPDPLRTVRSLGYVLDSLPEAAV